MNDYITAKERLKNPLKRRILNEIFLSMSSIAMMGLVVHELLKGVAYVN